MRNLIQIVESAALGGIVQKAREMGVKLTATEGDDIDLKLIQREAGADKGSGARVMKMLCDYADTMGKPIRLYVFDYHPKLEEFYQGFGFVTDEDMDDEAYMVRAPARFHQIVESSQDYMFHATLARNIAGIAEHGLVPNGQEPNWDGYPVDGRLYVSTTEDGAEWYAEQLQDMYETDTAVLRFPPVPSKMDDYGNGPSDRYTSSSVSPDKIEIKTEMGWQAIG